MDVEQIDVISLQLLQAAVDRNYSLSDLVEIPRIFPNNIAILTFETLGVVSLEIALDLFGGSNRTEAGREFGCNNHFIAIVSFLHPFTNPDFALFSLVVVGWEVLDYAHRNR